MLAASAFPHNQRLAKAPPAVRSNYVRLSPVHLNLNTAHFICRASSGSLGFGASGSDPQKATGASSSTGSGQGGLPQGHASLNGASNNGTHSGTSSAQGGSNQLLAAVAKFASEQFLPLMLLAGLALAWIQPAWGLAASKTSLQAYVTASIFIIQGFMLQQGQAAQALADKASVLFGIASILFITPLAAPLLGCLPLQPPGIAFGLLLFFCMPTTLSAGVALTTALNGNTAMALLLTISSNLLSVFTVPFVLPAAIAASSVLRDQLSGSWPQWLLAAAGGASSGGGAAGAAAASAATAAGSPAATLALSAGSIQLEPLPLLKQLVLSILLPTLIGVALRQLIPSLAKFADSQKKRVSYLNGFLLCMIPWMQVSKALSQGVATSPVTLALAIACALVLHVGYLAFNTGAIQTLRLGTAEIRRALIIVTSQKTLPVAMAVLARLSAELGPQAGVAAMTCVFCHLAQTCFDFWLVSVWNGRIRERAKQQ